MKFLIILLFLKTEFPVYNFITPLMKPFQECEHPHCWHFVGPFRMLRYIHAFDLKRDLRKFWTSIRKIQGKSERNMANAKNIFPKFHGELEFSRHLYLFNIGNSNTIQEMVLLVTIVQPFSSKRDILEFHQDNVIFTKENATLSFSNINLMKNLPNIKFTYATPVKRCSLSIKFFWQPMWNVFILKWGHKPLCKILNLLEEKKMKYYCFPNHHFLVDFFILYL